MTNKEFLCVMYLAWEIIVSFAQDVQKDDIIGRFSDNIPPVSECNGTINGETLRIDLNNGFTNGFYVQSQDYPDPYGASLDCTWIIYGNLIVVEVVEFSLEARGRFLVWDTLCDDYVNIGGDTFCGKELKSEKQLRHTHFVSVTFHTDKRSVATGFQFYVFDEQPPTTKPTAALQTTKSSIMVEPATSSVTMSASTSEVTTSKTATLFAKTSASSVTLSPLSGTTVFSARNMPSEQGRYAESYSLPLNQLLVIIASCSLMAVTSIFARISAHYRSAWMQEVTNSSYSQELTQMDKQGSNGNTINQISALHYETAMIKNEIYSTGDNNNIQFDGSALAAETFNHKPVMVENDIYNATKDKTNIALEYDNAVIENDVYNGVNNEVDDNSMVENDVYNGVSKKVDDVSEKRQDGTEKEQGEAMIENDIYDSDVKTGFDANEMSDCGMVAPVTLGSSVRSSNFHAGTQKEADYEETEESLYETVD